MLNHLFGPRKKFWVLHRNIYKLTGTLLGQSSLIQGIKSDLSANGDQMRPLGINVVLIKATVCVCLCLSIGQGVLAASTDSEGTYKGQYRRGIPWGEGTYRWNDGRSYVGEWRAGKASGRGKLTESDGSSTEGMLMASPSVRPIICRSVSGIRQPGDFS